MNLYTAANNSLFSNSLVIGNLNIFHSISYIEFI